jgi:hypothetical protein
MSEPPRRRTKMAVISFILMLLVTAKRGEHHPGQGADGGSNGIVSTLTAVPEILADLAQLLSALTK